MIYKRIYNKNLEKEFQENIVKNIEELETMQAIANNHDGITGTMRQYVAYDLIDMLIEKLRPVENNLF